MRKLDFDRILDSLLHSSDGISDLIFTVGRPFQVEAFGELIPVYGETSVRELTPFQCEQIALFLIGNNPTMLRDFIHTGSCDTSYAYGKSVRLRVNIFRQRGNFAVVMRKLEMNIPSMDSLDLPPIVKEFAHEKNGLILVTGATGSGKTTTLASILDLINATQPVHIVTLEDPIEFVYVNKLATFSQREMGVDFADFSIGLRAALRQAPKVILLGEMRDRVSVEIALTAAETGHLVFSTLHTIDAGQSINRIIGLFDQTERKHIRMRLSDTLRYVMSQRLAPRIGGGRQLLAEIMGSNLRTREAVEQGTDETFSLYDIIKDNSQNGWCTFDQSILRCYEGELITEDTAMLFASQKGTVRRAIDTIKKVRDGMSGPTTSGLKLDLASRAD